MADFIQDYLNRKALLWGGIAGGQRDWTQLYIQQEKVDL